MDAEAQTCIDAIDPVHRPLFDRVHRLILGAFPEAGVVLAYGMPTSSPVTRGCSAAREPSGCGPRRRRT